MALERTEDAMSKNDSHKQFERHFALDVTHVNTFVELSAQNSTTRNKVMRNKRGLSLNPTPAKKSQLSKQNVKKLRQKTEMPL